MVKSCVPLSPDAAKVGSVTDRITMHEVAFANCDQKTGLVSPGPASVS
ncbi:unnamed protein product, partial [marine sediment metagenome]